jgi:hypothetical protein
MMRRSRGYAGGDKPKLLGILHIASVTSGTSIEGDRIRSAQHPILAVRWTSGLVFRGGRCRKPPKQRRTSGVPGVSGEASPLIEVKISGPHRAGQYLRRALSACFLDFDHYRCRVDFRRCLFAR